MAFVSAEFRQSERTACKRLVRDPLASAWLTRLNREWAMDFIVDGLANGRLVRIHSVVEAYTGSAWCWRLT